MFKKITFSEKHFFILLFLFSLGIYILSVTRVKSFIWGDSLYYYAYTRSIVIDQDIDFKNEAYHPRLGFPNLPEISEKTGMVTNKFSPGSALLWIPAFIAGQVLASLGNKTVGNEVFLTDGYGVLPQLFVGISTLLFSVVGLWYVYKTLQLWFEKSVAILSVILLFFGTQLFYYTAVDPINSHSASFLLSSLLFYFISLISKTGITWQKMIAMGCTAGLLMLVRNQDMVVVLPVFFVLLLKKKEKVLDKLNWLTLFGGTAFIVVGIQFITTITLFGILGSPYLIRGEVMHWLKPDFIRVLFTLENGLFFFAPLLFLAVVFLVYQLRRQISELLVVSLVTFLLQLYIVASWAPEIIGGPYGSRMFLSVIPHLAIGVAYFVVYLLHHTEKRTFWFLYTLLLLLFFGNMVLQTLYMLVRF